MNYARRNEILAQLGFITYEAYLKSSRWQTLSTAARERAERRCQLCNRAGELHVHHRTYDRLGTVEEEKDLVVLCGRCHERFHGIRPELPPKPKATARTVKPKKRKPKKAPVPAHLAPLRVNVEIEEGRKTLAQLNARMRARTQKLREQDERDRARKLQRERKEAREAARREKGKKKAPKTLVWTALPRDSPASPALRKDLRGRARM